jgi:hypothetical protein
MSFSESFFSEIEDIYPDDIPTLWDERDDNDIAYERSLETEDIDWESMAYEMNDPKHPNYHETFSDLADLEDIPF